MNGKRILIVEDEPLLRDFLCSIIEDAGGTPVSVERAEEALQILRQQKWDMLITDVRTPGELDGWDLAWAAHDYRPDLPVIVNSGWSNRFDAALPPTASFVEKPWAVEHMLSMVEQMLGAQRPVLK